MKILIADKSNDICAKILNENGIEAVVKTGMTPDELKGCVAEYEGIIVRSATTLTKEIIDSASNLKATVRAGIGVDNIDIPACTEKKVLVMNTPLGNAVSTAEHAIAMMMSLCRFIPQANASTHAGKWEKKKYGVGIEAYNKTLGIIGLGAIGSIVADRALGLRMKVIAYNPTLTPEKAEKLGVESVSLEELYKRSDFISYHVSMRETSKGMINKEAISKMKDGVRIVNCARGGIMNEADIKEGLESGKIAGFAIDVFPTEPAKESVLFGMEKVIATPHIAASTKEAQVNVARQAAEQISDYLLNGVKKNTKNGDQI
ncbi:MAG: hydroxyacid dehydrogenase [Elusimicrobiota bacterium]|nr:hydroxyacid dehydrogenase [Elusimicrobiota bacterium]